MTTCNEKALSSSLKLNTTQNYLTSILPLHIDVMLVLDGFYRLMELVLYSYTLHPVSPSRSLSGDVLLDIVSNNTRSYLIHNRSLLSRPAVVKRRLRSWLSRHLFRNDCIALLATGHHFSEVPRVLHIGRYVSLDCHKPKSSPMVYRFRIFRFIELVELFSLVPRSPCQIRTTQRAVSGDQDAGSRYCTAV